MKPEPFDRKSMQQLASLKNSLKLMLADISAIKVADEISLQRLSLVQDMGYQLTKQIREIFDRTDYYGTRRREEAAKANRLLPAPPPVMPSRSPIVTPRRPAVQLLLPGPGRDA